MTLTSFPLPVPDRIRKSDRLLALAVVLSAGLHLLLMSGGWLAMPHPPQEFSPLEVRLEPAPPDRELARVAAPHPKAAKPRATAAPSPKANERIRMPHREDLAAAPADARAAVPAASDVPEATADAEPARPDAVASYEPAAVARAEDAAGARSLPRRGTILFTLAYGRDGFIVGRAVQSWEAGAGRYKLASDAETTGVVDIFRPQRLRWLSQGKITPQGLLPESFLMSRTRRGKTEAAEARFDWSRESLTFGLATERTSAALRAGTQDIMSFIYQLGLAPPQPGRFLLPITTGSRFETYGIEVLPEENIETPLGTVRALPVRQERRPNEESIEIWLAPEYRYLPVKIRYFDREGKLAGEQLAAEIRVSED